MGDNGGAERRRELLPIEPWARSLSAALGLGGVGAGAYALFTDHSEAGGIAFLAFGTLFLLLSLLGYMPSGLKAGSVELTWQREVGELLAQATESAAPEVRTEIVRGLEASPKIPEIVSRPTLSASDYENMVRYLLNDIVTNSDNLVMDATVDIRFGRIDTTIRRKDSKVIFVHIAPVVRPLGRIEEPRSAAILARLIKTVIDSFGEQFAGYLYITNSMSRAADLTVGANLPDSINRYQVQLLVIKGPEDRERLERALHVLEQI